MLEKRANTATQPSNINTTTFTSVIHSLDTTANHKVSHASSRTKKINANFPSLLTYIYNLSTLPKSMLHLNLFTRTQPAARSKYILANLLVIGLCLVCTTHACDIWKVHDCQGAPTKAEEELMKSDEYSTEQLYKFCDKGKAYVDCMNAKLKCCDLKMELKSALRGYDKQLEKQAWILGPFCSGLGSNNVITYKCRTTRRPPPIAITTLTPTKSTRPTMPPCKVEKVRTNVYYKRHLLRLSLKWSILGDYIKLCT